MKDLRILSTVSLFGIMLIFSGCAVSTMGVITDYDRDADFSSYNTYYWSDDFQLANQQDDPLFYNTLIKKRLKMAIEDQMEGRGYQLDPHNPDLLVNSRVIVEQSTNGTAPVYNPYYGYYPIAGYQGTSTRKEGGVIVELIDKERLQLVWQGYAPDVLRTEAQDKRQEIKDAISKIFASYEHRGDAK